MIARTLSYFLIALLIAVPFITSRKRWRTMKEATNARLKEKFFPYLIDNLKSLNMIPCPSIPPSSRIRRASRISPLRLTMSPRRRNQFWIMAEMPLANLYSVKYLVWGYSLFSILQTPKAISSKSRVGRNDQLPHLRLLRIHRIADRQTRS